MTAEQIEKRYPFKNLPRDWEGLFAPDNGVINVQLLLRTLARMAKDYGADAHQYVEIKNLKHLQKDGPGWKAVGVKKETEPVEFIGSKVILTCGAYVNHVLESSFDMRYRLDIWEMVANYFSVNPGPNGTVFPSE